MLLLAAEALGLEQPLDRVGGRERVVTQLRQPEHGLEHGRVSAAPLQGAVIDVQRFLGPILSLEQAAQPVRQRYNRFNVFAILGLRSLYFTLADMIDRFRFLKVSLAMVLAIVGLKMLLAEPLKAALGPAFNIYLLLVVLVVLAFGVVASLWTGPAIEREALVREETSQREEPPAA